MVDQFNNKKREDRTNWDSDQILDTSFHPPIEVSGGLASESFAHFEQVELMSRIDLPSTPWLVKLTGKMVKRMDDPMVLAALIGCVAISALHQLTDLMWQREEKSRGIPIAQIPFLTYGLGEVGPHLETKFIEDTAFSRRVAYLSESGDILRIILESVENQLAKLNPELKAHERAGSICEALDELYWLKVANVSRVRKLY